MNTIFPLDACFGAALHLARAGERGDVAKFHGNLGSACRGQRYAGHFAPVAEALAPFICDFSHVSSGAADPS